MRDILFPFQETALAELHDKINKAHLMWGERDPQIISSRLLQFNQSKSARNVNFIMFLALFTCFYIVYMDVYML